MGVLLPEPERVINSVKNILITAERRGNKLAPWEFHQLGVDPLLALIGKIFNDSVECRL
jgi:hypothetical protein